MLDHHDIETLQNLRDTAIRNGTNFTVWFGHYPTSSIAMPSYNIRHIMSGPYLWQVAFFFVLLKLKPQLTINYFHFLH